MSRIGQCTFLTYESDVSFVMRYMVDSGIVGASWITLDGGSYIERLGSIKESTCQVVEQSPELLLRNDVIFLTRLFCLGSWKWTFFGMTW